jgi:hypothetical protein
MINTDIEQVSIADFYSGDMWFESEPRYCISQKAYFHFFSWNLVENCGAVFTEQLVIVTLWNVSRCAINNIEITSSARTSLFPYYKTLTFPAVFLMFRSRHSIEEYICSYES